MKTTHTYQVLIRRARPLRGSGEMPNGLGMAQLWPILNAPSMRPVVHSMLSRCRERLAVLAAWVREMYLSIIRACGSWAKTFRPTIFR